MLSKRGESIDKTGISEYSKRFYEIVCHYHQYNSSKFISFSHGNPIHRCPIELDAIFAEIKHNLDFIRQYYPIQHVLPDIKTTIHDYFARENFDMYGMDVTLGSGVISLIHACLTVLCDPGGKILMPTPFYGLFEWIAKISSTELITFAGDKNNEYKINAEDLDQFLHDHPDIKTMLFVNPHNPTGHVYRENELISIVNVLERHPEVNIIVNEIYHHVVFQNQFVSFAKIAKSLKHRTITLRGFSKDFGLAKERVGIALANNKIIEKINLFYMGSTNGVAYSGQLLVKYILQENFDSYIQNMNLLYQKNLDILFSFLDEINAVINQKANTQAIKYIYALNKPSSGFFLCVNFFGWCQYKKIPTDFALMESLLNATGISLAPGCLFGWRPEDCIVRLTYSQQEEQFEAALQLFFNFLINN